MNTPTSLQTFHKTALGVALSLVLTGFAVSTPLNAAVVGDDVQANHFSGSDRNWFNPGNWSLGRVPGADDTVVLDHRDDVLIDPASDPARHSPRSTPNVGYAMRDLIITGRARLETVPGTLLIVETTMIDDNGDLTLRSSAMLGGTLIAGNDLPSVRHCPPDRIVECELQPWGPGFGNNGLRLNPTPKSKRDVILKSSVGAVVGLGGMVPASIKQDASGALLIAAGEGHYATLTADTLSIDGSLQLSLHYGFQPRPGDSFQILTAARSASGKFRGIAEGGYVGCTDDNIAFRLSYRGGDGNDVVVSAEAVNSRQCLLLPAIQQIADVKPGRPR